MRTAKPPGICRDCRHFRNDPELIEDAFKGLSALSSAFASARADDGLCLFHGRYFSARSSCKEFTTADTERLRETVLD